MAGFRTRRKTNDQNYTGINGTLHLPNAMKAQPYSGGLTKDGVFLYFFYNFYNGPTNVDIGLYYTGNSWNVFASGTVDYDGGWKQYSCNLSAGQTIQVAAYPEGDHVIVFKLNSTEYKFNLKSNANIWSGCYIGREMNIVPQRSPDPCYYKNTNCYFQDALWYDTSLNKKNGGYENLSVANSRADTDMDSGDPALFEAVCVSFKHFGSGTAAVKDSATIDFRLSQLC